MDTDKLNKVILKAPKSEIVELDPLTAMAERGKLSKLWELIDNPSHRVHDVLGSNRSTFTKGYDHSNATWNVRAHHSC